LGKGTNLQAVCVGEHDLPAEGFWLGLGARICVGNVVLHMDGSSKSMAKSRQCCKYLANVAKYSQ